jgi:hypothetical protein
MKSSKAKWLKDYNLETNPDHKQGRSRKILAKIKLYLQNLTVIRIIKLDFRFGDNRTNEILVTEPVKIQRIYVMPSIIPDPPEVRPEEWDAVQGNRSNQGLGSVRRNNEIFNTSTNSPTRRQ